MASKKQGERYSLAWPGHKSETGLLDAVYELSMAKNTSEIIHNIKKLIIPVQSMVFATIDGDIGYAVTGKLPKLKHIRQGAIVKDGTDPEFDWRGYWDFEDVPHIINPKKGYIVAANNKAATDNIRSRVSLNQWTTSRAKRIDDLIKSKLAGGRKVSVDDMKEI
jgi:penicillin amidase